MKLSEACRNLDAYIRATDYLILVDSFPDCDVGAKEQRVRRVQGGATLDHEGGEEVREEQWIQRRELYPFVGEVIINSKTFIDSEGMRALIEKSSRRRCVSSPKIRSE